MRSSRSLIVMVFILLSAAAASDALRGRAEAQLRIAAHVDGVLFADDYAREEQSWELDPGIALGASAGWEIAFDRAALVPELAAGYAWLDDPYGRGMLRLTGGARVVFDICERSRAGAFVHAGWGSAHGVDGDAVLDRHGLTIDGGGTFEVSVADGWAVGGELGYGSLIAETGSGLDASHWLFAGAQAIWTL